MIFLNNAVDCCGCASCMNACPQSAISMQKDKEGFSYPFVTESNCIKCGICNNVCPVINKTKLNTRIIPTAFAAKSKDYNLRMRSSSGGIFSVLADYILKCGGVVFGVAMNSGFTEAEHIIIDDIKDLGRIRGSKYLQSNIRYTYQKVKEVLGEGKKVLFSGTPCQVAGLKLYLGKEHDNLICMDVICHGVPSSLVWEKYIAFVEKRLGKIIKLSFRSKTDGRMELGQKNVLKGEKVLYYPQYEDCFLRLFLSDVCLRPSCYECVIKQNGYLSDVTLGDYWSINRIDKSFNDGLGVSLVIVRTEKGHSIINNVSEKIYIHKEPYEESIRGNSVIEQTSRPKDRDIFFGEFGKYSITSMANKYAPLSQRIKVKILLRKIGLLKLVKKIIGGNGLPVAEYGMKFIIELKKV